MSERAKAITGVLLVVVPALLAWLTPVGYGPKWLMWTEALGVLLFAVIESTSIYFLASLVSSLRGARRVFCIFSVFVAVLACAVLYSAAADALRTAQHYPDVSFD